MIYSNDRILTTHAGSLPRPDDVRELVAAKAVGERYDQAALAQRLPTAVEEVVRRQRAVGVDIVNDGEYGKSNFTNYVRERIEGFEIREHDGGREERLSIVARDSRRFRDYFEANPRPRSRIGVGFPVCVEELRYSERGWAELQADIANFTSALEQEGATWGFLPANTPGTV